MPNISLVKIDSDFVAILLAVQEFSLIQSRQKHLTAYFACKDGAEKDDRSNVEIIQYKRIPNTKRVPYISFVHT